MRLPSRLFVFAALLVAAVGCDPGYEVTVNVKDAQTGAPVPGALVDVTCSAHPVGGVAHWAGTTDANGRVVEASIGYGFQVPCSLQVTAAAGSVPPRAPYVAPVANTSCGQLLDGYCQRLTVDVALP